MKHLNFLILFCAFACALCVFSGCSTDEAEIRKIVREEIIKDRQQRAQTFALDKFGFGGALEKEWSHSQGVKAGNMIFVAGQQPYDTNLDDKGMPLTDKETGKSFPEQLRIVLENVEKVLANYGATMDDVVFLQGFIDEKAGKNSAGFDGAAQVIQEFFPNGRQSMMFVSVDNLFGPEQLIEVNAIAMVGE